MVKPGQTILKFLKSQGRSIDLPLDQLREFQEFEKAFADSLHSYDSCSEVVRYAMQSFIKMEVLAFGLMATDEFAPARRCYEEVIKLFGADTPFDDGITLKTWIYSNFPAKRGGPTLAEELLRRECLTEDLRPFVEEITRSRFGVYDVIHDGRNHCQLRELFTNKDITLNQSLGGMSRGNIVFCRAMRLGGAWYSFGNATEFAENRRSMIEDMLQRKMVVYFFSEDDTKRAYDTMMRLAGPYWFSIVAEDYRGDILNPDHYLRYYK